MNRTADEHRVINNTAMAVELTKEPKYRHSRLEGYRVSMKLPDNVTIGITTRGEFVMEVPTRMSAGDLSKFKAAFGPAIQQFKNDHLKIKK